MYSLSLNPPQNENVSIEDFGDAIQRVENKLGLTGQPRAIVFHEKNGRRHAHAVWSRIILDQMKAVQLPHTKFKLRNISRELYMEHGWKMPRGFMNSAERDPGHFTLEEWQQARRARTTPREIQTTFQECWAVSDTQGAFKAALAERGYTLARGHRGFVAVDFKGGVTTIARGVGIRSKEIGKKLTDIDSLPSVEKARAEFAGAMESRLRTLKSRHRDALATRQKALRQQAAALIRRQREDRKALKSDQEKRKAAETRARQGRFNTGLRGLLDRVSGKRRRIAKQNEREAYDALLRDRRDKNELIFRQLGERRALQKQIVKLKKYAEAQSREMESDIAQFEEIKTQRREEFEQPAAQTANRAPSRRGRALER